MKKAGIFFALWVSIVAPVPTFAWGPTGHEVIAYIAQDNLSPTAMKKVGEVLSKGDDLASVSNWADHIRNYRRETAQWHYIDLPVRKNITAEDETDYCPNNDCVLNQVQIEEGVLANSESNKGDQAEALKFLIHFVGDLHMPLHCADDSDRGGNEKKVRFMKRRMNLHALWDHLIEKKSDEDPRELAIGLEKDITPEEKAAWVAGTEKDWALESYLIAKNTIYVGMEAGAQDYSSNELGNAYYKKMRPIVNVQLEKAGIRLAHILNDIYGN
jgi:hypothetical protein